MEGGGRRRSPLLTSRLAPPPRNNILNNIPATSARNQNTVQCSMQSSGDSELDEVFMTISILKNSTDSTTSPPPPTTDGKVQVETVETCHELVSGGESSGINSGCAYTNTNSKLPSLSF